VLAFEVVYFARWLLIASTLIGSAANALASNEKVTLHLELDSPKAARGGQTGLDILPEIEPGWHINAHTPTETYLIPTEVQLTLPPGVSTDTINYPLPERKTFAFAQGKQLLVYKGKLDITTE